MNGIFREHLEKFITVNDTEYLAIAAFFQVIDVRKKDNLLVEGEPCRWHYFVLNGCLRKFFINDKGVEQTTEFAIETWWMTDNMAYEHKRPTDFYIQAVEDAAVLYIDWETQEQLVAEFPQMERYFRFVYQRAFAAAQIRLKYLYDFSKEEIYDHLCRMQPAFVQRIPQYLIASYLGFTPEYLSEIRKKKRS
ncbi:Crp/Fnr family transcriptional regulator [Flavobacterium pallidum]|uniref:Crp/Fnr family transcriptional regulator n=1 Tax=Flavobacterium pallidum TaxID=2172098 RepID=A0A2S1SIL6_9FLAO|nr:Crp/Fnr family transcriptional regulator [Flavobacterium pallidum]AWI26231.1 Crp/Fnr family transcriptional regulator [Flavobacterium pallidum]